MLVIQHRHWREYNTDPQRRCYNGAHFSSEWHWTAWGDLETLPAGVSEAEVERRLKFWRDLSDYAVSQRGESGRSDYRVVNEAAQDS